MNNEQLQAQLLDDYLAALQLNPNANIPDGLDPEMAEFARLFVVDDVDLTLNNGAQARVYQTVQAEIMTTNTMDGSKDSKILAYQEKDKSMKQKNDKLKISPRRRRWIPLSLVAGFIAVVGAGLLALYFGNRPQPNLDQPMNPSFIITATALVDNATQTALPPTVPPPMGSSDTPTPTFVPSGTGAPFQGQPATATPLPTSTIDPFMAQATQIIMNATSTAGAPMTATALVNGQRVCDFEGEFVFRVNMLQIGLNDELIMTGAARNLDTESIEIEIFGGFLTNDDYQTITTIDEPSPIEGELARVGGDEYPAGNYLVQFRLLDENDATLSSCGLPVTFFGS